MNPGNIIKLIRTAEGIAQSELASKLGVTRAYLSQVENSHRRPSISFLNKVSEYFSIPLPLLFFEEIIGKNNEKVYEELREIFAKVLMLKVSKNGSNESHSSGFESEKIHQKDKD